MFRLSASDSDRRGEEKSRPAGPKGPRQQEDVVPSGDRRVEGRRVEIPVFEFGESRREDERTIVNRRATRALTL